MSGVFKFVYDPHQDYEEAYGYNRVEVSGGAKEDNLDQVFDIFIDFLSGCGYVVDRNKVGYGGL